MKRHLVFLPVIMGGLVLVATMVLSVLMVTGSQRKLTFQTQAENKETVVSIFPQKGTLFLRTKDSLAVGILLESEDKLIDRVDLVIGYDPKMVEVTNLAKGTMLDDYVVNKVDNTRGEVLISAANKQPKPGNGILASFRLKPKVVGTVQLSFKQLAGVGQGIGGVYAIDN